MPITMETARDQADAHEGETPGKQYPAGRPRAPTSSDGSSHGSAPSTSVREDLTHLPGALEEPHSPHPVRELTTAGLVAELLAAPDVVGLPGGGDAKRLGHAQGVATLGGPGVVLHADH